MRAMLYELGLLFLRVSIGCLMLLGHGLPKLLNFRASADGFADPLGIGSTTSLILAIGAEVGCSALLIVGLFTRLATIPLIVTMLVAALLVHAQDDWLVKERAVLFLVAYVALLIMGPGRLSLDAPVSGWRARRRARTKA